MRHVTTRRDRCYFIGRRAATLSRAQAAEAWAFLATQLEGMADVDIPKFNDLLKTVRVATIQAKQTTNDRPSVI